MKGRCNQLFNFLPQLSKAKKGLKASERQSQGTSLFPDEEEIGC
jgi:hypothetical protein